MEPMRVFMGKDRVAYWDMVSEEEARKKQDVLLARTGKYLGTWTAESFLAFAAKGMLTNAPRCVVPERWYDDPAPYVVVRDDHVVFLASSFKTAQARAEAEQSLGHDARIESTSRYVHLLLEEDGFDVLYLDEEFPFLRSAIESEGACAS